MNLSGYISRELVEACVQDWHELPPNPGISYRCFLDAASGVPEGDSYAIAIGHKLGDRGANGEGCPVECGKCAVW
jgi:hypothetical protein